MSFLKLPDTSLPPQGASPQPGASQPATTDRHGPPPQGLNLSISGGLGLIRAISPDTLGRGKVSASTFVNNFDRNPGDIDFLEFSFQVAVGVTKRSELFMSFAPVLRTNSVNQDPLGYPTPPLDLFIDTYPNAAIRSQPYFLFPQELPYKAYPVQVVRLDPPVHGAFSQSSGDIVLGGEVSLRSEARGDSMGLGI